MASKKILILLSLTLLSSCVSVADKPISIVEQIAVAQPIRAVGSITSKPIALDKVIVFMEEGAVIGENRQGVICFLPKPRLWPDSVPGVWVAGQYHEIFREILKENNYSTVEAPTDSLFGEYKPTGKELVIRAKITEISENYCSANSQTSFAEPAHEIYKGSVKFSVYWEIYSISEKKVIFKAKTQGSAVGEKFKTSGEHKYFKIAFGNALKNLLANKEFNGSINNLGAN